ncbi:MAG TPA: hypothetical protein PLJ78_11485 [Anaerolineae bacterium]|nr:hypothetical protein [Anaerolineae bacterium]HQK14551.1 hypothetical protein [Anaerolineae bacterium]
MPINAETILQLLKQTANSHQGKLKERVDERLDERERRVLKWLFEQYEDESKRRWYDPYHILFSTNFALRLVEEEKLDRLIVPGIILHDIGYFALEDKSQWSAKESRITHMQEGVPLAARVLCENEFSPLEIEKILGMISVHDNPYIGLSIHGRDRLGLRDCDRIWVMHLLSFYKDLTSKSEGGGLQKEFLHDRMTQFYGWKHPFENEWEITIERVIRNAPRIEIPTYNFTQEYVKKQFKHRLQELESDVLSDADKFRAYLNVQIDKE